MEPVMVRLVGDLTGYALTIKQLRDQLEAEREVSVELYLREMTRRGYKPDPEEAQREVAARVEYHMKRKN